MHHFQNTMKYSTICYFSKFNRSAFQIRFLLGNPANNSESIPIEQIIYFDQFPSNKMPQIQMAFCQIQHSIALNHSSLKKDKLPEMKTVVIKQINLFTAAQKRRKTNS